MPPGLALWKQSLARTTPVSNIFYGSKGVRANEVLLCRHIGVGRGGGGGRPPPNNLGGGPAYPLAPPNNPPAFSFNFYVKREKNHQCTKLKGKIIINVTLIWFEGTGKTISLNSIFEFSIISDFKMRIVIIWHWFIKNLVGTWRRNDVDATSLRRIDVITTSCACWEFGPPPLAPPIF